MTSPERPFVDNCPFQTLSCECADFFHYICLELTIELVQENWGVNRHKKYFKLNLLTYILYKSVRTVLLCKDISWDAVLGRNVFCNPCFYQLQIFLHHPKIEYSYKILNLRNTFRKKLIVAWHSKLKGLINVSTLFSSRIGFLSAI